MDVDGQCHCGAIAFQAQIDPAKVVVCHCTDCQVTAGAPYTFNVPALTGTFKIIKGAPSIYIKTTADSGRHRAHAFCPTCATRIYSGSVNTEPPQYTLRAGALRQRRELKPARQIWCSSALEWAMPAAGERVDGQ